MRKIKKIFFLLLTLSNLVSWSQINCSINIVPDTLKICKGDSVQLQANGTKYELAWSPKSGLNDSTLQNPIAFPKTNTKYYVSNEYLYPDEKIVNGDFEQGDVGFGGEYVFDCTMGSMIWGHFCLNTICTVYWQGWGDCSDHTSGSGNMLISDASLTPNTSIWCETVTVTPNVNYLLTTWVASLASASPAVFAFYINNQLIDKPIVASTNPCEWKEFSGVWNSAAATSAQICIFDTNTVQLGNDFIMDDISFKEVCFTEDSVVVVVNPAVSVNLGPDKIMCEGDSVLLNTNLPINYKFNWSNGATNNQTYVTDTGKYSVLVNNLGCTATDSITLSSVGNPISTLEKDTNLCFAFVPAYTLHGGSALSYNWSTGEKTPNIVIDQEGLYQITLSNGVHCTTVDSVHIKNYCDVTYIYVPNTFTPNGDGLNDVFKIAGENIYVLKMYIFNRWGEEIFETNDPKKGWDGNQKNGPAPTDVYVVMYEYEGLSPNTQKKESIQRYSNVNLIR